MIRFLRGSTGAGPQLLAVALVSGALSTLLCLTALQAAQALLSTPAAWWGMSQLGSAVVCLACGAGALGAAWHLASAMLALAVVPRGRAASRQSRQAASMILERWGAPLVRRIAAGALVVGVVGMASSPAMAAQLPASGDDLGWQPTSSATQEPTPPGPQEDGAGRPEAPAEPSPAAPTQPTQPTQPTVPEPSSPRPPAPDPAPEPEADAEQAEPGGGPAAPAPSTPQPPAHEPRTPGAPSDGRSEGGTGGGADGRHVVAPGESLWSITSRLLPEGADDAAIARAWPSLYRANAEVIGPNPSLIRPGTPLLVPEDLSSARTTKDAQH